MNQAVYVGLSGGVDSSVAAALLKDQGYHVTAVFMKNWTADVAGNKCPWEEDLASARVVAAHLQIPLKIYDFQKEYRAKVADYMVDAYRRGLTPNPDVMCNQEIKFRTFYDMCRSEGADFVATGHYARMHDGQLLRGVDRNKDQSYFLYRMPHDAAEHALFPVGEYEKSEIRHLAERYDLPTAKRPDSQGLCFVGNVSLKDFLHEFIDYKPGDIVDDQGHKIGQHDGAFFYTIGQRHGLGVGGGKPYFVYDKDMAKNEVYVTTDPDSALLNKDRLMAADEYWWQAVEADKVYDVQVRYRSTPVEGRIMRHSDKFEVVFSQTERAIAPGQSVVIYDGDVVIGGGIIQ